MGGEGRALQNARRGALQWPPSPPQVSFPKRYVRSAQCGPPQSKARLVRLCPPPHVGGYGSMRRLLPPSAAFCVGRWEVFRREALRQQRPTGLGHSPFLAFPRLFPPFCGKRRSEHPRTDGSTSVRFTSLCFAWRGGAPLPTAGATAGNYFYEAGGSPLLAIARLSGRKMSPKMFSALAKASSVAKATADKKAWAPTVFVQGHSPFLAFPRLSSPFYRGAGGEGNGCAQDESWPKRETALLEVEAFPAGQPAVVTIQSSYKYGKN